MSFLYEPYEENQLVLEKEFPTLYGKEKNGKIKIWKASVFSLEDRDVSVSIINFGQEDGKKQVATREYNKGKNIGKKNETTYLQQCIQETERKWKDKTEKEGYVLDSIDDEKNDDNDKKDNKNNKYLPMLAQTYEFSSKKNKKNNIKFPCFVQPKLDGLRCIVYMDEKDDIKFQSRTGTYFETMGHIEEELKLIKFPKNVIFDGELYTDDIPFEELAGLIKKKKLSEQDLVRLRHIKYNIYDIVDQENDFSERTDFIHSFFKKTKFTYLKEVPTYEAEDEKACKECFGEFVEKGYEGIMLRNKDGMYRCNYRSHDLQKYKEFMESEYPIVGYKEGDGRDKGTVIWLCVTKDGKEFNVRPRGTIEMRKEWFETGKKYVGKMLTVIYQELSEMGVPRFPVGKDIRCDY